VAKYIQPIIYRKINVKQSSNICQTQGKCGLLFTQNLLSTETLAMCHKTSCRHHLFNSTKLPLIPDLTYYIGLGICRKSRMKTTMFKLGKYLCFSLQGEADHLY